MEKQRAVIMGIKFIRINRSEAPILLPSGKHQRITCPTRKVARREVSAYQIATDCFEINLLKPFSISSCSFSVKSFKSITYSSLSLYSRFYTLTCEYTTNWDGMLLAVNNHRIRKIMISFFLKYRTKRSDGFA